MDDFKHLKIPKGTIIKVYGHPIKLKTSLYIKEVFGKFELDDHIIMEAENVDDGR